jgi:hypothetical protein
LQHLITDLSNTGAGVAKAVDAQRLCEIVHAAYNPAAAVVMERARAAGEPVELCWEDVGPAQARADSKLGAYWHDGAVSRTWEMSDAPRGHFRESVLAELLAPNGYVPRKRVTLLYRVLAPGEAAQVIERDVHNAVFRVNMEEHRAAPRLRLQAQAAQQASEEEARGAAVVMFGMLVTATVLEEDGLAAANAAIENAAPTAKIALRLPRASQDSLFAAALPCGVWLADHMRIPQGLKDAL